MKKLDRIGSRRISPDLIITQEIAREISEFSRELGRQIGLIVSRAGKIELVIVGDHKKIVIPVLSQVRGAGGRLKGLRCVHTHLSDEDLTNDDLTDLLFLRLDMMSIIKVGPDGLPGKMHSAHLAPTPVEGENWVRMPPVHPSQQPHDLRGIINALEEEFARFRPVREVDKKKDRAILVSVSPNPKALAEESMQELVELARSDDIMVLDTVIQRRDRINPKFILGKGKLSEIMLNALTLNANLLIFDQELNPSQIRSITDHTELRVIDRTQLILDIFARRALSREGKLQVEAAQLKYMLPRLSTRDDALSRLTGGIGARGPGETRLEIDRRRIKDRIGKLDKKLRQVSKERHQRRSRRRKKDLPVISLVGYTNAGKSTLLNTLTSSAIIAEDKLFATLDPTSRRLRFPKDMEVIITDTVGFIKNLPDELLKAFKSTLEELHEADLLIHVIDVSNPAFEHHLSVVENILHELGLDAIACLRVFNKIDKLENRQKASAIARLHDGVPISAIDPETFDDFLEQAQKIIMKKMVE